MKFALIVDSCKVESYTVREGRAYKFKNPEMPYSFHHSIGNECFMGFWSYPFVFNGHFLNWSEWKELPTLDLEVIFVSIEKKFDECTVGYLRKKYPNAKIYGYVKETWNWDQAWQKRLQVFNECDHVIVPVRNFNIFPELVNNCSKPISFLPQPVDVNYLYDNFYIENRQESLFLYDVSWNQSRRGETSKFCNHLSTKYNLPIKYINTQTEKNQWLEFIKYWPHSTFHINLDPNKIFPGQQAIQCAALGVIQLGGYNDSHSLLFPETATNDFDKLESKFLEYVTNFDSRTRAMTFAFDQVNKVYSFDAVRDQFKIINKN